jgi:hypothetical protein
MHFTPLDGVSSERGILEPPFASANGRLFASSRRGRSDLGTTRGRAPLREVSERRLDKAGDGPLPLLGGGVYLGAALNSRNGMVL